MGGDGAIEGEHESRPILPRQWESHHCPIFGIDEATSSGSNRVRRRSPDVSRNVSAAQLGTIGFEAEGLDGAAPFDSVEDALEPGAPLLSVSIARKTDEHPERASGRVRRRHSRTWSTGDRTHHAPEAIKRNPALASGALEQELRRDHHGEREPEPQQDLPE